IGYAGLKDKTSLSTQKMSVYDVDMEKMKKLDIRGVRLYDFEQGDRINIGELEGNFFSIVVRDIEDSEKKLKKDISKNLQIFEKQSGFVNYFGYQRFGTTRPVTALVGKYIIKGDFENAALTYLGKVYPLDPYKDIRKELLDKRDFKKSYENFPASLKYERAMLFKLAHEKKGYKESFKALPSRLQMLFVHAYQAQLFNKIVKRRVKEIPPNEAEIGDTIVIDKYERKAATIVNKSNIEKVDAMIKNNVSVSAPLIGSKTILPKSRMGEITKEIMEDEEITFKDFGKNSDRVFNSRGAQREILARFKNFSYEISEDLIFNNRKVVLSFYLKKGEYATEFIKQLLGKEVLPYRKKQL
ncbi:MAG: tRNA pseudouridine(13) synthase TruD, partial [Candidatus Methanofastidiosia archaeon]